MPRRSNHPRWNTVAIVGMGLIGSSLGLDLLGRRLAREVVGIGRRAASLRTARAMGACTRTTLDLERGVRDAELIVVCTPVDRIADHVRRAAAACPPGALLTDAGSTKAQIVAALAEGLPAGATFVGSHPLAGSEQSGPAAAVRDLYAGRTVIVTPTAATPAAALAAVKQLWTAVDARVVVMSPEEHDRALAATSHVPHLAAYALAGATPPECLPLVAGGWLDTTRVAASPAELWTSILRANRASVLTALGRYETVLAALRHALERDDPGELAARLDAARRVRLAAAARVARSATSARKAPRTARNRHALGD